MYGSYPDTVYVVCKLEHVERMGKARAARRTAEARRSSPNRLLSAATSRRPVGSILQLIGRGLQTIKSGGLVRPTMARGDTPS
jgi:hypothetical protein